ncbi:MAG: CHAT domain-containing tetratricopeptide repeat protein [Tagaea sp.]
MVRIAVFAMLSGVVLVACTPEGQRPIAGGEAAAVRLATAQRAFVPPPRTIADVLEKLDRELATRRPDGAVAQAEEDGSAPLGPAAVPRAQAPAQTPTQAQSQAQGGNQARRATQAPQAGTAAPAPAAPTAAAPTEAQIADYLRRANEARTRSQRLRNEGRIDEHLAASREALDLALRGRHRDSAWFMGETGQAEMDFGNRQRGIDLRVRAVDAAAGPVAGLELGSEATRVLASAGRMDEARAMLRRLEGLRLQAMQFRDAGPWAPYYAQRIDSARAAIERAAGNLPAAEAAWRSAAANAETMHARVRAGLGNNPNRFVNPVAFSLGQIAGTLIDQSRFVEAEVFARRSLQLAIEHFGPYHPTTIFRIEALTNVLIEQGRFAEAENLAGRSLAIQREMRFPPTNAGTLTAQNQIATALLWQGKYAEALAQYRRTLQAIGGNRTLAENRVTATRNYGVALLMTGDSRAAQTVLDRVARDQIARFGDQAHGPALVRGFRALAVARNGDAARAVAELREIAPVLERGPAGDAASSDASGAAVNRVRRVLIGEMVGLYADLAAKGVAVAGFDPADAAFRFADLARGMSVQGAIAQMSARAGAGDPALEAAIRSEQDAARQIEAIRGVLADIAGQPADQRDARIEAQLGRQVRELEADRRRINEDLARRFPDYEQLRNPRPPSLADAQRALKPDEALVAFFVGREASYVWAVRHGRAPSFAAVPLGEAALARDVAVLRQALDPNAATLDDVPAFDVGRAHRLYAALLGPVEAAIGGARAVTMVPHGPLGQLPLAVLVTKPPGEMAPRRGQPYFAEYRNVAWLVRETAISQVPSVAAFRVLRGLPAPAAERRMFAGFGDPWFSAGQATPQGATQAPQEASALATRGVRLVRRNAPTASAATSATLADLAALPDTADEVLSVARALGADAARDVFLGRNATEAAVIRADLARRRFVMFATHGLIPGELDGLTQPALALTAPDLADGDGDGLLTMEEILRLRLDADWVVLSACNTASGDGDGAEAVSGLGRAFFYAGARALLVTSWPVETTSARLLTTDVFARQAADPRLDRASALRRAMLGLIDTPADGAGFVYAHPIFWAPFLLVGDGG